MYVAVLKERAVITFVLPSLPKVKMQRIFNNTQSFHLYSTISLF